MSETVNVINPSSATNESSGQDKRALLARLLREKASRPKYFPPSFAQQRLWLLDQFERSSPLYNMIASVRLRGALDLCALRHAFTEITRRHESLRTTFTEINGEPMQVVHPAKGFDLQLVDLVNLPAAMREAEAHRVVSDCSQVPFDLSAGPLLRAMLVRLEQNEHILLLTMHHIVSDGWSMNVLAREAGVLYHAFSNGLSSPLPELPIQYADYSRWQREQLSGAGLEAHLDYWRRHLDGELPLLELPADRPRPAVRSIAGATCGLVLPKELSEQLRALSRSEHVTMFMLMLAAFKTLLYRYTGQPDIIIGTPVAGRERIETESLIGFFINMVAMRSDVSDNPSFREFLGRIKDVALGAFEHQDMPFDRLVDELHVTRSFSHSPIFQVCFDLRTAKQNHEPEKATKSDGLKWKTLESDLHTAKFDLSLIMTDAGECVTGFIEYRTDMFDETTIKRLRGHFETLLESLVSDPGQRLLELQMLTETERQRTLGEWSQAPDETVASEFVHEMFSQIATRCRDNTAIVYNDKSYSYGELEDRANTIANYLIANGAQKGSLVGILAKDSFHVISAIIGILKAGCVFVPFDRQLPQKRLATMVSLVAPEWFIIESRFWSMLSGVTVDAAPKATVICVDGDAVTNGEEHLVQAVDYKDYFNPEKPSVKSAADDMAYIYFTSGSTGQPKAIAGRLQGIDHFIRWEQEALGVGEGVRVSRLLPISFDASLRDIFLPLCSGGIAIGPAPRDTVLQARKLVEWIEQHEINVVHCVPSLFRSIVNETLTSDRLPSLKFILMAGEPLLPADVARWMDVFGERVQLVNLYGASETTMTKFFYFVQPEDRERRSIPIGKPMAGAKAMLVNAKGDPSEPGTIGEIYVRTPYRSLGYYNQPELTQKSFVPDPFGDDEIVYKTGDLARVLEDGNYEFLGRKDQQVKIRGIRVELGEIENLMRGHEGVRDVAIVDRDDANGFKYLCAYVVFEDERETNPAELRDYLATYLPEYMLPSSFVPMQELPRTISGKLDRRALPAPGQARREDTYVAPRTPVEEVLAGIWSDVLRTTRIGVNDNFFELSGHSLLAMQVVSRVREAFGVEIFVRAIFEKQTLAMLAAEIEQLMYQGGSLQAAPVVRTSREVELPLSFAQQRLWFIDRLTPLSPLYNMPMAVRLTGALNLAALERTFREIVRRHEVLRTSFVSVKGEAVQVIRPEVYAEEICVPLVDLSLLPEELREVEAKQLAQAEAARPFDVETDSLMRTCVLRLDEQQHIALLTFHHIVFDGWSMGVFVKEVVALYSAFSQGQESPLAELPVQYADYAVWQHQWLQDEVLERHIGYWKQQLEGAPELLELPADRPRPAVQTYRGASVGLALSQELTAKLRELCRAEGVTLFMLLLATFKVLLARYTGQEDISVGTPIAGRNRVETESLIGFFVNTLVLRTDLAGNPTVRELLRRVRDVALGAYAHQELPFEKLVEELQVERSLSHTPLFQVLFVLHNTSEELLELPGLSLSTAGEASEVAKFDLTLNMAESDEAIIGALQYNTDLFDETTIKRMLGHWQTLVEAIVADSTVRLSELALLTDSDHQLLSSWNDTDYADPVLDLRLHELFELQVERTPDAMALIYEQEQLTYGELNVRANQLAHHLRSLGVDRESLVGVLMERSTEMVTALLAIVKAGAAYVPLDPSYPQERLSFMLADAGIEILLTQSHLSDTLTASAEGHSFNTLYLDQLVMSEESTANPQVAVEADNAAYMIYTSGSTGRPKGVVNTHRGIVNRLVWMQQQYQLSDHDRVLQKTPFSFDVSVWEFFWPLMTGARLVVARPGGHMDANYLAHIIHDQGVTTLHFVPSMLQVFLEEKEIEQCRSIRQVMSSGEALGVELEQRFFERMPWAELHNLYGPTEAAVDVSYWQCAPDSDRHSVPIGLPIANTQLYVLDKQMKPVAVGVHGEVYIGGVGLARGYKGRAELTAEKFVPNPFSERAGARLYRTGDVGRWLEGGEIEYIGRIDEQVKIRGFRIELGEIASVIKHHEGVQDCVVIVNDEGGEKRIVAYVVCEQGATPSAIELTSYAKARLPEYMVPSAVVMLESLPLTPNGKLDRKALPAPSGIVRQFVEPRTIVEQGLAEIWAAILRLDRIGVHDNFFEVGGHSLLGMQMVSRVREAFQVDIQLRALFGAPTVAQLAEVVELAIRAERGLDIPPVVRVSREGPLPLSFAQQRLWFLYQLEPDSPAYNIPIAVRLQGALNVPALEESLNEILRRHEVLRTTFSALNGEPVQIISPFEPRELCVEDLSVWLDETARLDEARRLTAVETATPFDLINGPLFRARLLRLDENDHVVILTMHHIVSDGWSLGILINELTTLYRSYSVGESAALPELPIQYADFAQWQRTWLDGEILAEQLAYWSRQLGGAAPLELPTDRPRPAVLTYRGNVESLRLDSSLVDGLKTLSRNEGVTLFMLLMTAFKVLLHRYTGQSDISVGTPIAGRNWLEVEGLIGFFVNTVVLRTDVRSEEGFNEVLQRVREVVLDSYAHQDVPFEKLVEELQPERDPSRQPLFQVAFSMHNANANAETAETSGLRLSALAGENRTAKFDLNFVLTEVGGVVDAALEYNTDLFDSTTIERMLDHFRNLLDGVVIDPKQAVALLPLLGDDERQLILHDWNDTNRPFPSDLGLHQLFEAQVERAPDATALIFGEERLSYAELEARANALARYLRTLGVSNEQPVGICLPRSAEMVVALLAVLKAGGVYVPLDADYPSERLRLMAEDTRLQVVITNSSLRDTMTGIEARMIELDTEAEAIAAEGRARLESAEQHGGERLAYIIYTSGSTGRPKGVAVPQSAVARLVFNTNYVNLDASDRIAQASNASFDAATFEVWGALLHGACLVGINKDVALSPQEFAAQLREQRISAIFLTTALFNQLAGTVPEAFSTLRHVMFGGEAVDPKWVREVLEKGAPERLLHVYGPTESTTFALWHHVTHVEDNATTIPIGQPLSNTEVYLLDQNLQPVPVGAHGEIYLGGDGLARCYYNCPDATAEKFVPNPFGDVPGSRLYKTGDLGRFLPNGDIQFVGRIDHQVKVRGFRIELGEIEGVLSAHPDVQECIVLAREDTPGERRLVAYVVSASQALAAGELRLYLQEKLPDYMIPAAFVRLDALPLTRNGKVDRRALPPPEQERMWMAGEYVAPRSPLEEVLAEIWADVLKLERVGIHDNFFTELGGHSLLATQVTSRVRNTFEVNLPLRQVFEMPTIAELATVIETMILDEVEELSDNEVHEQITFVSTDYTD
ncbi:MAG TPA: amino acid adenylation domain-containing protein [Pyrinomonadaceae bacterium]